jgi:crotonobetainyl-CoA:carnitine CoA-transferase CaiB-like acyl-CoA transferase
LGELPLSGIRVLDLSSIIAAPVTATMLGDFGAEIVKVEEPGRGDFMRRSAATQGGRSLMWLQDGRNKSSITLDLRQPEGRAIVHRLLPHFDAMVTNFRTPTLTEWGFDPATIRARHPRLVALYVTGYGLTGPYRERGGFDRVASAFSGLTYVSGDADGPSVRGGYATIDYMTAYLGAFGVVTALYHRDLRGGEGQVIDLALYEPGFRASEDALMRYSVEGAIRERTGNINPNIVPAANFTTSDGREITIHAGTDSLFVRLAQVMGRDGLAADPRFATNQARVLNQSALYAIIAEWVATAELAPLMARLVAAEIPASPIMSIADIAADPHYRERGTIVTVRDDEFGDVQMAAPLPRMSETPGRIRSLGPALGSSNRAVYGEMLGMSEAEIAALAAKGVI